MQRNPELRPMPRSDAAFAAAAERLAADASSPAELERLLRGIYPHAVVRERGLANEPIVLYLYRDGAYRPDDGDEWWLREQTASAVIDLTSGRITDASAEWASMLGNGVEGLVGRSYAEFLQPEARAGALALIEALLEHGEVTSEMVLRRFDGRLATFAFHATLDRELIRVVYRPLG